MGLSPKKWNYFGDIISTGKQHLSPCKFGKLLEGQIVSTSLLRTVDHNEILQPPFIITCSGSLLRHFGFPVSFFPLGGSAATCCLLAARPFLRTAAGLFRLQLPPGLRTAPLLALLLPLSLSPAGLSPGPFASILLGLRLLPLLQLPGPCLLLQPLQQHPSPVLRLGPVLLLLLIPAVPGTARTSSGTRRPHRARPAKHPPAKPVVRGDAGELLPQPDPVPG